MAYIDRLRAVELLAALIALHRSNTGFNMQQVLAADLPIAIESTGPKAIGNRLGPKM